MPELTESKPIKLPVTLALRPAGIGVLLVVIAAFIAGAARRELVLTLTGAVFLTLWVYCLLMTLLLAFIHRRRARRAGIRVSPREISAGGTVQAVYSEGDTVTPNGKIFQLPGILIRCRLLLATKDGRKITKDFSPAHAKEKRKSKKEKSEEDLAARCASSAEYSFTAEKRGGYFSSFDEFAVFDILGFFRFAFRLPAEDEARLLVSPHAADEPPAVNARAGDSSLKPEFSFQRTDNLIDHRPYIPGDDPRRINWKLYGHGGGLFVREGEREPPPHSNIVILIDTEYDHLLYSAPAARRGIDLLCENALAAAVACTESGMDVVIGFTGGAIYGGNAKELASVLALPSASAQKGTRDQGLGIRDSDSNKNPRSPIPDPQSPLLPNAPDDRGVIVLALPRTETNTSSLDRFLNKTVNLKAGHENTRRVDIIFFSGGFTDDDGNVADVSPVYEKRLAAAAACAALYSRRPGVTARAAGV